MICTTPAEQWSHFGRIKVGSKTAKYIHTQLCAVGNINYLWRWAKCSGQGHCGCCSCYSPAFSSLLIFIRCYPYVLFSFFSLVACHLRSCSASWLAGTWCSQECGRWDTSGEAACCSNGCWTTWHPTTSTIMNCTCEPLTLALGSSNITMYSFLVMCMHKYTHHNITVAIG